MTFPRVSIPDTEVHQLHSQIVPDDFELWIARPQAGFTSQPRETPKVLYVLDANLFFGTVVEMTRIMHKLYGELPPILVVGIAYPTEDGFLQAQLRNRDLTPSEDARLIEMASSIPNSERLQQTPVLMGGANRFLGFLEEEVKAFVSSRYEIARVDSTLFGSSLGGLFVMYALLSGRTTFDELVLGTYGIEGSKPGAAAAGVYLSHAAIPLTRQGYGKILGRTIFNCKAFHLALCKASLESEEKDGFIVVPTPKIELSLIQPLLGKTPKEILNDSSGALLNALRQTGSDLNLITYAFNYKVNGVFNQNLAEVNAFNKLVYERVSVKADGRDIYNYEILLSTTDFVKEYYGEVFFNDYRNRLLKLSDNAPDNLAETRISVMRSTIMDPWITEYVDGAPFVEYIVAKLFDIVREVVAEVKANPALLIC